MLLQNSELKCLGILFDMDGTLLNSHAPTVRAYTHWANKYGLDPAYVLREAQGRRTADSLRALAPSGVDVEGDIRDVMLWEREDIHGIVEIPGACAFLQSLPSDRWAIVTSADRTLALTRLKAAGLPLPAVLITAEDVQFGKPSPEGYLLAANKLGIDATRCVVFEDAPAGLAAGIQAGAQVIAIASPLMEGRLDDDDHVDDFRTVKASTRGEELIITISS